VGVSAVHGALTPDPAHERERLRQRLLQHALSGGGVSGLQGWARVPLRGRHTLAQGLAAYSGNAAATAERALRARFPTVAALLGESACALLARAHWRQHPPQRGDLAQWGATLPDAIAQDPQLASEPYLADVARLDEAVFQAAGAADAVPDPDSLLRCATLPPERLRLWAPPGAALLRSPHPVVSIWRAHHDPLDLDDPFAPVRQALAHGQGETAWVWRQGWAVRVTALDPAAAAFTEAALLHGHPL